MKNKIRDTMVDLQQAMLKLRAITGDKTYSHAVRKGEYQLQRIVYNARGTSTVTPLSGWQPLNRHLNMLENLAMAGKAVAS